MNTHLRTATVAAALACAAAAPATAAAHSAYGVKIGPEAEVRYTAIDFQLENQRSDAATIHVKVTARGHVFGQGDIDLDSDTTDWKGAWSTSYAKKMKLHGTIRGKVTGYTKFSDGRRHPFSQTLAIQTGSRGWDGTYKATNGLRLKVKDGFLYDLSYGTLAYCTRSATNTNAFYSLPYDQLPAVVRPNGTFATKGHLETGKIQKLTGRLTRGHRFSGYASWSWYNIFAGPDPGDYDYCATGGKFHGRRVSKRV